LREICPREKRNPKSGANIGAITGILLIVASHPDIKHAVKLVEFQVGTSTHRHIRSWKRRLRGTIMTTINDEPIKNEEDIKAVIQRARNNK
jgi:hypothetical protein